MEHNIGTCPVGRFFASGRVYSLQTARKSCHPEDPRDMEQQFVAMDTLKKAAPTVRFASQAASRTLLPLAARGDAVRGIFVPIHQGSSPVSHDHPTMTIPPGSGEKHGIDREKTTTSVLIPTLDGLQVHRKAKCSELSDDLHPCTVSGISVSRCMMVRCQDGR